jgi:hypothetical protein
MNSQETLSYSTPERPLPGGVAVAMRIISGVLLIPLAGVFLFGLLASFEYPGTQELGWKLAYVGAALGSLSGSAWLLFTAALALISRRRLERSTAGRS